MSIPDDIDQIVARAIDDLEDVDGVRTWPGASEADIKAAEAALGVTFPADYRALLKRTNGLEIGYGRRRYFGVGGDALVDIAWFNDPRIWLNHAYPDRDDLRRYLHIGTTEEPWTTAYSQADLRGADLPVPVGVAPHHPSRPLGRRTLLWLLTNGYQKFARNPFADKISSQYIRKFGHVPMDKVVLPGPMEFFEPLTESRRHVGAALLSIQNGFIAFADLWEHANEIEQGPLAGKVRLLDGVDLVDDPRGWPRARWRTEPLD